MKPFLASLAICAAALAPASLPARDAIFLSNGETRVGRITALDDRFFRIEIELAPPPGAPEGGAIVTARLAIPRADVVGVEFSRSAAEILAGIDASRRAELAGLWKEWEPYLGIPKSPAGAVGNAYATALLETGDPAASLQLSNRIEKGSWSEVERMAARRGRLRAMIASGAAVAAQAEAREFALVTEDPAVLIEAKHILAVAADASLRQLVKDNPRWQEDIHVIPERNRLYHEALDTYLYPYLFLGSEESAAARGLWAAAGLHRFCGEDAMALECARDLVALYPGSPEATEAAAYIESLPRKLLESDPAAAARKQNGKKG